METSEQIEAQKKISLDLKTLQSAIRHNPELYMDRMVAKIKEFIEEYKSFEQSPGSKNFAFMELVSFLAHVFEFFRKDLEFFVKTLIDLMNVLGTVMHPYNRLKVIQALVLLRNKGLLDCSKTVPFFISMLGLKDKEVRRVIIAHLLSDLKKIKRTCKSGQNKTRELQNYLAKVVRTQSDSTAKRTLYIMIELYNRQIWRDEKNVNAISVAALSENSKMVLGTCRFLIMTTEFKPLEDTGEEESDEDDIKLGQIKFPKGMKKNRSKLLQLSKKLKKEKRTEKRRSKLMVHYNYFPIDQIATPQDYCEKLFLKLRKSASEKFEVKFWIMRVLSRMIGRHKIILLDYCTFLKRYVNPHNKDIGTILAIIAEAAHHNSPMDELEDMVTHLINKMANDTCKEEYITYGLNAIREICSRCPNVLDAENLNYLAGLRNTKEKNVAAASRALINLYRDINPSLLRKVFLARRPTDKDKDIENEFNTDHLTKLGHLTGSQETFKHIEGAELLTKRFGGEKKGVDLECDVLLDDDDWKAIRKMKRRQEEKKKEDEEEEKQDLPKAIYMGEGIKTMRDFEMKKMQDKINEMDSEELEEFEREILQKNKRIEEEEDDENPENEWEDEEDDEESGEEEESGDEDGEEIEEEDVEDLDLGEFQEISGNEFKEMMMEEGKRGKKSSKKSKEQAEEESEEISDEDDEMSEEEESGLEEVESEDNHGFIAKEKITTYRTRKEYITNSTRLF